MKTAVEWLVDKIAEDYPEIPKSYREECQKAKEMEKEQIIEFAKDCIHKDDCFFIVEQYYNETFKSE